MSLLLWNHISVSCLLTGQTGKSLATWCTVCYCMLHCAPAECTFSRDPWKRVNNEQRNLVFRAWFFVLISWKVIFISCFDFVCPSSFIKAINHAEEEKTYEIIWCQRRLFQREAVKSFLHGPLGNHRRWLIEKGSGECCESLANQSVKIFCFLQIWKIKSCRQFWLLNYCIIRLTTRSQSERPTE